MKRALTALTFLSAVALCLLLVMVPVSQFLNLSRSLETGKLAPSDAISITRNYHLGFERGSLWLYTSEMPYRGGIMWLCSTNDPPPVVGTWTIGDYGFSHIVWSDASNKMSERACDLPDIYFRRFWWFDDKLPYTTLKMSLWWPVLPSAVLPLWWVIRRRKHTKWKRIIPDWQPALVISLPFFILAMWFGIHRGYSDIGLYAIAMALGIWHVAEMAVMTYRKFAEYRRRRHDV